MDISENERVAQLEMKMLGLKSQLQQKDDRIRELEGALESNNKTMQKWLYSSNPGVPTTHDITDLMEENEQALNKTEKEKG